MLISNKPGIDGDGNTWVSSVRLYGGLSQRFSKQGTFWVYKSPFCATYFAMKSVVALIVAQPTHTNRDASCLPSSFPILWQ